MNCVEPECAVNVAMRRIRRQARALPFLHERCTSVPSSTPCGDQEAFGCLCNRFMSFNSGERKQQGDTRRHVTGNKRPTSSSEMLGPHEPTSQVSAASCELCSAHPKPSHPNPKRRPTRTPKVSAWQVRSESGMPLAFSRTPPSSKTVHKSRPPHQSP